MTYFCYENPHNVDVHDRNMNCNVTSESIFQPKYLQQSNFDINNPNDLTEPSLDDLLNTIDVLDEQLPCFTPENNFPIYQHSKNDYLSDIFLDSMEYQPFVCNNNTSVQMCSQIRVGQNSYYQNGFPSNSDFSKYPPDLRFDNDSGYNSCHFESGNRVIFNNSSYVSDQKTYPNNSGYSSYFSIDHANSSVYDSGYATAPNLNSYKSNENLHRYTHDNIIAYNNEYTPNHNINIDNYRPAITCKNSGYNTAPCVGSKDTNLDLESIWNDICLADGETANSCDYLNVPVSHATGNSSMSSGYLTFNSSNSMYNDNMPVIPPEDYGFSIIERSSLPKRMKRSLGNFLESGDDCNESQNKKRKLIRKSLNMPNSLRSVQMIKSRKIKEDSTFFYKLSKEQSDIVKNIKYKSSYGRCSAKLEMWQFILFLLEHREAKKFDMGVKWTNSGDGTFIITNTKKLSELWGIYQGNEFMTYESMSRNMRHYYLDGKNIMVKGSARKSYRYLPESLKWCQEMTKIY